ncbi:hypothetical protein VPH35_013385 [Triticum aestivum]|uniref:Uncharacterized protein n=1 Tax=Aegilops tauschii subsp. strangulata TaxID=200361 RepID=A0A452XZR6_AEGTS
MEQDAPPVPHQAQDDGAVDGWARDDTEPSPTASRRSAPRRRSSSLPPPPCSRSSAPSTTTRWGGALGRPRRLFPRPQPLRPPRKKAAWIGDMYFGLGSSKGAIVEHLYQLSRISSSHGSHYDQVHSGAVMIVTENVSSRSNRYDLDLHTKSARVSTTKETGVRLSTKT